MDLVASALELSRWQFATTTLFHFIFVPITLGLAPLLAIMQTLAYRRPAEREKWLRLTQFFAGEMDRFGAHTPLSPERMEADWKYLRAKYPQDFTVTSEQARAWHRREAAACVKEKNAFAYLFHLAHAGDLSRVLPLVLPLP